MNMSKKKLVYLFCGLALTTVLMGCDIFDSIKENFSKNKDKPANIPESVQSTPAVQSSPVLSGNDVAVVGKWKITKDEFVDRLKALKEVVPEYDITNPDAKKLVLEELIKQQLLVEDADQKGLSNQKDINAAVEEFRRSLIVREVARKLTENIQVTDEEVKAYYDENKDKLKEPEQWRIREIVVADEATAKDLLVKILGGADFAETAKQNSIGKTAVQGGDLGFISEVPFPQMANALLALEVGGVSSVFKGPDGYYIVKVEDKKGGKELAFDEIKEDIRKNRLLNKQQEAILKYIDELKQKIKVQTNESLL
jgi:peptidyl-prolyl cis-trans isomerase C